MKKNEFKQYVESRGEKVKEVTVTIKGAEKLPEETFPIILANMIGQDAEGDRAIIILTLMAIITELAEKMNKEPIDIIMILGSLDNHLRRG